MPYDPEIEEKVREAKKVLKSLNPGPLEVLKDLIKKIFSRKKEVGK